MAYTLPPLPYATNALEPTIDTDDDGDPPRPAPQGLRGQPQQGPREAPRLANKPIEEVVRNLNDVPAEIRTAVRNNGGGHYNHTLFWQIMGPNAGGEPSGPLGNAITAAFKRFDDFKADFKAAALGQFGSGWAWLVLADDKLLIVPRPPTRTAADSGPDADPGHRRLGTRLLPQVPESPP